MAFEYGDQFQQMILQFTLDQDTKIRDLKLMLRHACELLKSVKYDAADKMSGDICRAVESEILAIEAELKPQ